MKPSTISFAELHSFALSYIALTTFHNETGCYPSSIQQRDDLRLMLSQAELGKQGDKLYSAEMFRLAVEVYAAHWTNTADQ